MKRKHPAGMEVSVILFLSVLLAGFIFLTELTVSHILQMSLRQSASIGMSTPEAAAHLPDTTLQRIRKPILMYLVVGALLTLLIASIAIHRIVARPLRRLTSVVEDVADGKLTVQVPVEGASELIQLSRSLNRMISTLRTQRDELENRIHQIEAASLELRQTQDELIRAARLASVGTLASGIAHEIGNPVAGVLGLLEALETETDGDTAQEYRQLIRKEMIRVDKTIADLLSYAREGRQASDEIPRCLLEPVFSHLKRLISMQQRFSQISLSVKLSPDVSSVAMSDDDLSSILFNLIQNAAQAMSGEGAIEIIASVFSTWQTTQTRKAIQAVRITVTDTGPGISPDLSDRVFEPFYSHRPDGKGSGLGLAICQRICEKHNAQIRLDDSYTSGARFLLTIPT